MQLATDINLKISKIYIGLPLHSLDGLIILFIGNIKTYQAEITTGIMTTKP